MAVNYGNGVPVGSSLDPTLKATVTAGNALRVDIGSTVNIDAGMVEVAISDSSDSIKIGNGSGVYASITQALGKKGIDVNLIASDIVLPVSQSGTWTVQQGTPPWSVTQSGTWSSGRTWTLSSTTDSIASVQSGAWNIGLNSGSNTIGKVDQGVTGISPWITNVSQFGGTNLSTGIGNSGVGIPRVTVSNDSSITNISGTISLPTGASTSANQTNGLQKSQLVDGSGTTQGPMTTISSINYAPVTLAASVASGTALVARSVQIAGSDGTNAQTVSTDTTGKLNINNISGTVSLPTGAATSANQTNGTQKTQQVDSSGNVAPAGDIAARSGFFRITDATNTATVKAASTAAVAADTSLVVALSPNTPVPTGSNNIGSITNITGTVSLPTGASTSANQTNGMQKTQVVDGSGTIQGPATTISGTNYMPVMLASSATPGSAVVVRSVQVAGSDGTNAQTVSVDTTGKLNINNISGTVSLPTGASTSSNQTNGTQKSQRVDASGNVAPAMDIAARAGFIKLTDGTNTTAIKAASTAAVAADPSAVVALSPNTPVPSGTNAIGAVSLIDGGKATYRAATAAVFALAASATDIAILTGSATKTIRLTRVCITGVQTTSSDVNFFLLKRSTANSGGTSTTLTNVPMDSNSAAATATALSYTANPTTGTLVGNIDSFKLIIPVAAVGGNTAPGAPTEIRFGDGPRQAVVLRGTNQVFAVNLGGTTVTGGSFLISFEWTEE